MASSENTVEALQFVDSLKQYILNQDGVIREQAKEIESLHVKVEELEKERHELRLQLDFLHNSRDGKPAENVPSTQNIEVVSGVTDSLQTCNGHSTSEDLPATAGTLLNGDIKLSAISSPIIRITTTSNPSSPEGSPGGTPVVRRRETKSGIKRSDSKARQRVQSMYELSPDIHDHKVRMLEKDYGGKEKANNAARTIQYHYRKWNMSRHFERLRVYSEAKPRQRSRTVISRIEAKKVEIVDVNELRKSFQILTQTGVKLPEGDETSAPSKKTQRTSNELVKNEASNDEVIAESLQQDMVESEIIKEEVEEQEMPVMLINSEDQKKSDESNKTDGQICVKPQHLSDSEEEDELSKETDSGVEGLTINHSEEDTWSLMSTVSSPGESQEVRTFAMSTQHQQQRELRIGINHFNMKPEKGIAYLIEHNCVEKNPEEVAKFLLTEPGLSKKMIGEYLGNLQKNFNQEALKYVLESMDFGGLGIDEGIRTFQSHFGMPGEAQKIERLLEMFSERYVDCNPGQSSIQNVDTVLLLSFAIVMLNTDLHNENVKKKMSEPDFVHNLRGTDNGANIPDEMLKSIYSRIKRKPLHHGRDHVSVVEHYEKRIKGKLPWGNLAHLHRQLRMLVPLNHVRDPYRKDKIHPRMIFLFNDLIIVTKERSKGGYHGVPTEYTFKSSLQLCDVKCSVFSNENYLYGVQLISRIGNKVLLSFSARDERTRDSFVQELVECIEETVAMESDRISCEKKKHLQARLARAQLSRMDVNGSIVGGSGSSVSVQSLDTISLLNSSQMGHVRKGHNLSSSMMDITDTVSLNEQSFESDPGMKRCNSSSSLDSAYVESSDSSHNNTPDFTRHVASSNNLWSAFFTLPRASKRKQRERSKSKSMQVSHNTAAAKTSTKPRHTSAGASGYL